MKNIVIVAIFVVVAAFFAIFYIRQREEIFEGTVIDKDVQENTVNNQWGNNNQSGIRIGGISMNNGGGVTHTYVVRIKTTAGKELTWQISEGMYEIIKIGDRVTKPKGTTELKITQQALNTNPQQSPPLDKQPPNSVTPIS